MKKIFYLLLIGLSFSAHAQVVYGTNNYIQYHIGNLPIVISVPHGGLVVPVSIPDRTCNSPTTVWDNNTIQIGRLIDTALFNLTGCRPHLIICNLRRTKIDCNRNLADGACSNAQAETAWTEFANYITTAQATAQNTYTDKTFYIDLHAHGHAIKDLELGYGLSGTGLANTDNVLNSAGYVAASSIKNLVAANVNGYTHAQLLRGTHALGTLFANANFSAVPSQQTPHPNGNPYFSGGYNTFNHTCIKAGNTVNGLQIETPSTVWDTYSHRKKFADSTAAILVKYLLVHKNVDLRTNCGIATLPIQLLDFSGKATDGKNILSWTTATETNNDYFMLMKSNDGLHFDEIAKIKGGGNSTKKLDYTFEDANLIGASSYYKISQVDYDGRSTASNVLTIQNLADEIAVFPNPTTDFIQFSSAALGSNYDIILTNTVGSIVLKTKNQNKVSISDLPKGVYFVRITTEHNRIYNRKIMVE